MVQYEIGETMTPLQSEKAPNACVLTLVTSKELQQNLRIPGLEMLLRHTPSAQDSRVCKTEVHRSHLCGTIVTPRRTKEQRPIAFGYLLAPGNVILCDDSGAAHTMIQRMQLQSPHQQCGIGTFFHAFLECLIAKDLHHLQELEDRLNQLEEYVLADKLENFNAEMRTLRKEIIGWNRYYSQLDDMVCDLLENGNLYFDENELRLLRMVESRINRLKNEAQTQREYGLQVHELFQAELDMRQNRIMKILTVVTTIFLPLTLIAGWYGMNFHDMPELSWKYGYPAVIAISAVVVLGCLGIMKKKKFW